MSWRRANSPGWAAFDSQQKPNRVLQPRINNEPFPSLPSTISSLHPHNSTVKNNNFPEKSFVSAALPAPPVSFPAPVPVKDKQANITSDASNSSRHSDNNICHEKGYDSVFRQLKVLYSWADDCLIEDIMAAVNNNFEKASSSLKAMVSDNSLKDCEGTGIYLSGSDLKYDIPDGTEFQTDMINPSKDTDPTKSNYFSDEKLDDFSSSMNLVPAQLKSVPIEPEWEEDDVYMNQRKDAIRMIRAASRHSKAAANSFLRGDHSSAQHFSQKSKEEWEAAEKLNQKAANEILSIRNNRNGMWKLDLHGLHAVEAVQALRERLNMIETQVCSNVPAFPGSAERKPEATVNEIKPSIEQPWIRQRPVSLEVITGIGNHSRGEAAIPTAVKSFLIDNVYRHEEARPGVIMVRPKFRRS